MKLISTLIMTIASTMIVGSTATDKCVDSVLTAGHRLYANEFVCGGQIKFGLSHEGRVTCIKGNKYSKLSDPAKYMEMQPDGNLVAYDKKGKPVFATHTDGKHGAALITSDTRAIVYKDYKNNKDDIKAGHLKTEKKAYIFDCSK